ncbi:hypothetical protein ABKN59_004783 [Abortiporus biennis]
MNNQKIGPTQAPQFTAPTTPGTSISPYQPTTSSYGAGGSRGSAFIHYQPQPQNQTQPTPISSAYVIPPSNPARTSQVVSPTVSSNPPFVAPQQAPQPSQQDVYNAVIRSMQSLHDSITTRLRLLEANQHLMNGNIDKVVNFTAHCREESRKENENIMKWVQKVEVGHAKVLGKVFERLGRLDREFGIECKDETSGFREDGEEEGMDIEGGYNPPSGNGSLAGRMKNMEYLLNELLEKENDPNANHNYRDIGISPHVSFVERDFADIGTDTLNLTTYVDAATLSDRNPVSEIGVYARPEPVETTDEGVDPIPQPSASSATHVSIGTSPVPTSQRAPINSSSVGSGYAPTFQPRALFADLTFDKGDPPISKIVPANWVAKEDDTDTASSSEKNKPADANDNTTPNAPMVVQTSSANIEPSTSIPSESDLLHLALSHSFSSPPPFDTESPDTYALFSERLDGRDGYPHFMTSLSGPTQEDSSAATIENINHNLNRNSHSLSIMTNPHQTFDSAENGRERSISPVERRSSSSSTPFTTRTVPTTPIPTSPHAASKNLDSDDRSTRVEDSFTEMYMTLFGNEENEEDEGDTQPLESGGGHAHEIDGKVGEEASNDASFEVEKRVDFVVESGDNATIESSQVVAEDKDEEEDEEVYRSKNFKRKRAPSILSLSSLSSTSSSDTTTTKPAPVTPFKERRSSSSTIEVENAIINASPFFSSNLDSSTPSGNNKKRLLRTRSQVSSSQNLSSSQTPGKRSSDQPPKKRRKTVPSTSSGLKNKTSKGKTKKKNRKDIDRECVWPMKLTSGDSDEMDENSRKEFVSCDACLAWYHLSCVGITVDDPRVVDEDAQFICPPCEYALATYDFKRTHPFIRDDLCARPDCDHPEFLSSGEYFVERFVGRQAVDKDVDDEEDIEFIWLTKWDGFSIIESTWNREHEIPSKLLRECIDAFERQAAKEGVDISDPRKVILLEEARMAGLI